jgi:hypothetical protein
MQNDIYLLQDLRSSGDDESGKLVYPTVKISTLIELNVVVNLCKITNYYIIRFLKWHAVAQLVVFLRYKPEIHGVDSRCCPPRCGLGSVQLLSFFGGRGRVKNVGA